MSNQVPVGVSFDTLRGFGNSPKSFQSLIGYLTGEAIGVTHWVGRLYAGLNLSAIRLTACQGPYTGIGGSATDHFFYGYYLRKERWLWWRWKRNRVLAQEAIRFGEPNEYAGWIFQNQTEGVPFISSSLLEWRSYAKSLIMLTPFWGAKNLGETNRLIQTQDRPCLVLNTDYLEKLLPDPLLRITYLQENAQHVAMVILQPSRSDWGQQYRDFLRCSDSQLALYIKALIQAGFTGPIIIEVRSWMELLAPRPHFFVKYRRQSILALLEKTRHIVQEALNSTPQKKELS